MEQKQNQMTTPNLQSASCEAPKGISAIVCLQIVGSIFGIVGVSLWTYAVDQTKSEVDEDDWRLFRSMWTVFLLLVALDFALAILLLIGSKKDKLGLLWAWLVLTGISAILGVISGTVSITTGVLHYTVSMLLCSIISGIVSAFMIYIVYRRIQGIKKISYDEKTHKA